MEKRSGLAQQILSECVFSQKDVLICVSTSGINGVPVEVAAQAKNEGIPVIGIASDAYLDQQPRNIYGLHLQQVCQICVDNAAPKMCIRDRNQSLFLMSIQSPKPLLPYFHCLLQMHENR